MPQKIALVAASASWEAEADDAFLVQELQTRGAVVETPAWDDPAVDWGGYWACLLRTTWDYHERIEEFLPWLERVDRVSRLFNPLAVLRWNTSKTYLADLAAAGLPVAPTGWISKGSDVDVGAWLADLGSPRGFLKPVVGAGAHATLRFAADADGLAAAAAHLEENLPVVDFLLQPYLSSVETEGEYSVIFVEGEQTHAVRKVPVPGDYRVMDEFGGRDELVELSAADCALAARVERVCQERFSDGKLLYARIDLLRGPAGDLVLNEAELVEPSMFFVHQPTAAARLASALLAR